MRWDKRQTEALLAQIRELVPGPLNLMEVCGTHTMSIARSNRAGTWIKSATTPCTPETPSSDTLPASMRLACNSTCLTELL